MERGAYCFAPTCWSVCRPLVVGRSCRPLVVGRSCRPLVVGRSVDHLLLVGLWATCWSVCRPLFDCSISFNPFPLELRTYYSGYPWESRCSLLSFRSRDQRSNCLFCTNAAAFVPFAWELPHLMQQKHNYLTLLICLVIKRYIPWGTHIY